MKTIQIQVSDLDQKIMEHEFVDQESWIKDVFINRIFREKMLLLVEAQKCLIKDPEIDSIPASEEGILNLYFSRPYYKNKSQRGLDDVVVNTSSK